MRHLFVALLGLLLGVAGGSAAIYYNPFTESSSSAPAATDRVLRYSLPDQVLEFSLGEDARLVGQPVGEDALWEETIARAAVLGLTLDNDSNQPTAVASRVMATSSATDLLLEGVLVRDYWLVTIPREGTLFVEADSNVWPFLKQALLPTWLLDRPWHGPSDYWPTAGPGADGTALVMGTAGEFEGAEGSAVERYTVTAINQQDRTIAARGELYLHLPGPQVAVQE